MINEAELDELLSAVGSLADSGDAGGGAGGVRRTGDTRDGRVYVVSPEIVTAVKVTIVTGRPLLLSGPPGCGKSSLASYLARNLGLEYFEFTVTDGSDPQDLLWRMDTVRRFNDAQLGRLTADNGYAPLHKYLEPGPLWWCLSPETARRRGALPATGDQAEPATATAAVQLPGHEPTRRGAVLLIDEIDKADSSFCNGLLVPLGSRQFFVPPIDSLVDASDQQVPGSPIVIITTNNERDLPEAFVRRCVALSIPAPTPDKLVEIAYRHFDGHVLTTAAQQQIMTLADRMTGDDHRQMVGGQASTAEFLDLVQALLVLKIDLDSDEWATIERLVVEKREVRRSRLLEW